jgi:hypothetical protein
LVGEAEEVDGECKKHPEGNEITGRNDVDGVREDKGRDAGEFNESDRVNSESQWID